MRFTKILAATMAAMSIMSCSEQVEDFGANVQPGDAVLSFKVGTNGGTTYATQEEEEAVNSLTAYLQYTDVDNHSQFMKLPTKSTGISTTLADGTYKRGSEAKLYFVANATTFSKEPTTEAEMLLLTEKKDIYSTDGKKLTLNGGMTATRGLKINLTSGTINTGTYIDDATKDVIAGASVPLKRLAARVYAESTTGTSADISQYKVAFSGLKGEANLFSYEGSGAKTPLVEYEIAGDGTGQFGNKEAVGYVYPSKDNVTITITSKSGEVKNIGFKPEANKQYRLKITPSNSGANIEFDVTIEGYDPKEDDLDVIFGSLTPEKIAGVTLPAGFEVADGKLQITQPVGSAAGGVKVNLSQIYKDGDKINIALLSSTLSVAPGYQVSEDGMFAVADLDQDGFHFVALPNSGADKTYSLKFTVYVDDIAVQTSHELLVVVKGQNLPANFTTKVNGLEFMSIPYQGDLEKTIELVNDIEKLSGDTFSDKCINYVTADALAGKTTYVGKGYTGPALAAAIGTICPAGFRLPTNAEVLNFYKGTKLGESLTLEPSPAVNTYGDVTITYVAAPNPNPAKLPQYYKLSDGTATIILAGLSNFATSDIDPVTKRPYRSITYANSFQPLNPATNGADTYVRCVKEPLELLKQ